MEKLRNDILEKMDTLKQMGIKKGEIAEKIGISRQGIHRIIKEAKFKSTLENLDKNLEMLIRFYK